MKKINLPKEKKLSHKLEQIDLLFYADKYKETLAELRELESKRTFVEPTVESGHFYTTFSATLKSLGNYKEALEKGLKAFDILKHTNDTEKIVRIQIVLGDIYVRSGDLKNAQAEYRDAFAFYRKQEPCKRLVHLYNRLARVCFMKGEFERAIEYLKDGIEHAKKLNEMHLLLELISNLSTIYLYLGKLDLSEELHLVSFRSHPVSRDEFFQANWFIGHAYILIKKRKFTDAKKYLDKSYSLVVKNGLARKKAIYHEYSGELAFETGDFLSAEKHYQEALKIGEQIAPEGDIVSQVCRLLAELRFAQGKYDKVLSFCRHSLEVSRKVQERIEEGIVYKILGQVHTAKSEYELAKENFEKGISILKEIGAKCELGKAYLKAGKSECYGYFERLKMLGRAEEVLLDTDLKYYLAKTYLALSELLSNNQEYKKAVSFAQDSEKLFGELKEKKDLDIATRIRKEIEDRANRDGGSVDRGEDFSFSSMVTQNEEMQDILKRIKQVLDTSLTILFEGETGTGKDLLAKIIHYNSNRKGKRYIALNCANLPETLFESELFGYKRGAFTGAHIDKKGLLEEADGGTLLLNEIGEMPLPIQAKLLSVIEEKEFTRLGDTKPRKVDVRFIAATNRDLKKAVEQRSFREDLYYRLSVVKVELPPLRERKEDIFPLVRYFLEKHCNGNCEKIEELSQKIAESLFVHNWPGNVRELENEILKFSTLVGTKEGKDLERFIQQMRAEKIGSSQNGCMADRKAEIEIEEIKKALKICNNVKSKVAEMLSMSESTLRRKIKIYNIS